MSRSTSGGSGVSGESGRRLSLLTSQVAQCEGINFRELGWVLPVVLDDVDIVRGCQESGKGGGS